MNKSGIFPKGDRILVKPDKIEEKTEGGIIIPESELEKHQLAHITGVLVDVGPDAWCHTVKTVNRVVDGEMRVVEKTTTGYSEPFAAVGERVSFARHSGLPTIGADGEEYRILNDTDVTATLSDDVDLTQFRKRERLS